jgi:hypothetical protein
MDELQTIREALKAFDDENFHNGNDCTLSSAALGAIERLEARAASFATANESAKEIAETIDSSMLWLDKEISTVYGPCTPPRVQLDKAIPLISDAISRYAYRYSEDIRKERDEWKKLSMDFLDIIQGKLKEAAK